MKRILSAIFMMVVGFQGMLLMADDFIAIAHEGKVYDSPNAKYATTNRDGDDVVILDGMVFRKKEVRQGWDLIEYSPGLNGFIVQSLEVAPASLKPIAPGNYTVANNPGESVTLSKEGETWIATLPSGKFSGQMHDGVLVFFASDGSIALSAVNKGGKTTVYSYDNSITRYF